MIITRMFFLDFFSFEVEVINLIVAGLARFPCGGQRSLKTFFSDVE
jgi:hypothetical protein